MAKRGTYAKTAARREEILNTALTIIAENGYSKATLKELADAVGLSQMGILHHFGSKEELFAAVLERRDAKTLSELGEIDLSEPQAIIEFLSTHHIELEPTFTLIARENMETPGLIQLFSNLLTEATEPDHKAHTYFQQRITQLRTVIVGAVTAEQLRGNIAPDLDPRKLATSFIALMDGLQTLWLYDPEINIEEHIQFFWNRISTR